MSYSFKVKRDVEGIRLLEVSEGMLEHVPFGTFNVNGHAIPAGTEGTCTLQISRDGDDGVWEQANVTVKHTKVVA